MNEIYITISDQEQELLAKCIEVLRPFDKEEVSSMTVYYEVKGQEVDMEYDTCNNIKCIKQGKANIRSQYGKGTHVLDRLTYNDGDHENIESCSVCFRPLVSSLTWIDSEFEHHKIHTVTYDDVTSSRNAFDLIVMFNSFPSNDHGIRRYAECTDELYEQQKQRQDEFKKSVLDYAKYILSITNNLQ